MLAYTNASTIIDEGFRDTEDLDGLFSGYHGDGRPATYDAAKGGWGYRRSTCRTEAASWSGAPPMYRMRSRHSASTVTA